MAIAITTVITVTRVLCSSSPTCICKLTREASLQLPEAHGGAQQLSGPRSSCRIQALPLQHVASLSQAPGLLQLTPQ
jgi:hypothetical protein